MNTRILKEKDIVFILVSILIVTFGTQSISYAQEANPTITASVEEPLTESTLHGSIITLTLSGAIFQRGALVINQITISGDEDATLNVSEWGLVSDTQMIIKLEFAGNIDTDATFAITLGAQTIAGYNGNPLTATLPVTAVEESLVASTEAPLTEANWVGIITLTLTGRRFAEESDIEDALSVSGIEGVTIERRNVERVNDTEAIVSLRFAGNIDTDATLTLTVGPDAIGYDKAFTFQFPVTAVEESLVASTEAPLTEATLHGSTITLTLTGRHFTWYSEYEVSISGIEGVTIDRWEVDRVNDTEATLELGFVGNIDTDAMLTLTVGPDAIGYDKAFTFQFPVTAVEESLVASTEAPLTEATLHGSTITLTLTGLRFAHREWDIGRTVSVSGIEGVTIDRWEVERVSDTEVSVSLGFFGNIDTDATLTLTVGPDAIIGYDKILTVQLPVTAIQLVKISGDEQSDIFGTTLANPLVVEVRDQDNNPLPDAQITFTVTEGEGLLNGESTTVEVTTDANGRATQTLTLGPYPGTNTVKVSIGNESVWLEAEGVSPYQLIKISGDEQSGTYGTALANPLVVEVRDLSNNPLPNAQVTFKVTEGEGLLNEQSTTVEVTTDASGRAAQTLILDSYSGTNSVEVSIGYESVTFEAVGISPAHIATLPAGDPDKPISVAFSPKGTLLAYESGMMIKLWDATTHTNIATLEGHERGINSLAFSPDGTILASGASDGTVKLWDVTTHTNIATLEGHIDEVSSVSFSPNGALLASGAWDGIVKMWDITTKENIATFGGHDPVILEGWFGGWFTPVSFSPGGTLLAFGAGDSIKLLDVATKEDNLTFEAHEDGVISIAFSPDGKMLASTGRGFFDERRAVKLWDVATGENITTLAIASGTVSFSPDGTLLAFGAGDSIELLDVVTKEDSVTLEGHEGPVTSIAFSSDGNTLASGAADGTMKVWDISSLTTSTMSSGTLAEDVNNDGVINIQDLVLVAGKLGQTGTNSADVNGDGTVNIQDLVLVAGALGTTAAAPSLHPYALEMFTTTDVKQWLSEAQHLDLTDTMSQRGILFLQQLLTALTPKETTLLPNYPNPFNPETWIPYHLAKDADGTLHIYAVNGTLVRTLALGHQPAGMYQSRSRAAYWDGKNAFGEPVASGVYFYTLTAGGFSATRKMLIRK